LRTAFAVVVRLLLKTQPRRLIFSGSLFIYESDWACRSIQATAQWSKMSATDRTDRAIPIQNSMW